MVLIEQISALMDFLENHQDLALGHCSRTIEGRSLMKRYWMECAQILNCVSVDCPNKTPAEWRTFYNEYKSKMLKKIKSQKTQIISATGGGPATEISLTPLQERLYSILRRDVGEPLPGVRHNPLTENLEGRSSTVDQPSKRRRRQRSARRDSAENSDHAPLEAAQSRLEAIEARNAEATLKQAEATLKQAEATLKQAEATLKQAQSINNLAGAIDRLSSTTEKMVDLICHCVPKKKLRRIMKSSDSESD